MTLRVEMSGTQRITYTQAWDVENRLAVVTNTVTGAVTRFGYDGDGNRVQRTDASGVTVYVSAYYEKNVTTGAATTYYFAGSTRVAVRTPTGVYWLHGDHLGSASLTTDASGNRVGELRYKPYGETRSEWGVTPTGRRFTGQLEETGLGSLYDYGARRYSPVLGRFLSADTIVPNPGHPQSLNRYAYTLNNPLKYTDPTGHAPGPWWVQRVMGGLAQYLNDMSWGAMSLIVNLDNVEGTDFQEGRAAGRYWSEWQGKLEVGIGLGIAASGISVIPPTAGVAVAAAPESVGTSVVVGGVTILVEGGVVVGGLAEAAHGAGMLTYIKGNPVCPNCKTTNPEMMRARGAIAKRQHITDPANIGKDGVSALCKGCKGSLQGKFWGRSSDEIQKFAQSLGLDPEKAVVYTPQFGGEGHYSLFIDAIGPDGYLLPEYADKIDAFLRAGVAGP